MSFLLVRRYLETPGRLVGIRNGFRILRGSIHRDGWRRTDSWEMIWSLIPSALEEGCVPVNIWQQRRSHHPLSRRKSYFQTHRSVFLNTALILWSFKVKEDPKSPIDEWAFTESINTYPLPFKAIFEPRIDLRELLPWFRPEH